MAFEGVQTVIDNKLIENVPHFKCLECEFIYQDDKIMTIKIYILQRICNTILRILTNNLTMQVRFHRRMAMLTLLYGLEYRVPRHEDLRALQTAEVKSLWSVQRCSRVDRVHNDDIFPALEVEEFESYN